MHCPCIEASAFLHTTTAPAQRARSHFAQFLQYESGPREKFYCDRHCQFVSSSSNCQSEELERTASRQKLGVTKTPLLPDQRTGLLTNFELPVASHCRNEALSRAAYCPVPCQSRSQ